MIPSYWSSAAVLVFIICISEHLNLAISDCDIRDQFCESRQNLDLSRNAIFERRESNDRRLKERWSSDANSQDGREGLKRIERNSVDRYTKHDNRGRVDERGRNFSRLNRLNIRTVRSENRQPDVISGEDERRIYKTDKNEVKHRQTNRHNRSELRQQNIRNADMERENQNREHNGERSSPVRIYRETDSNRQRFTRQDRVREERLSNDRRTSRNIARTIQPDVHSNGIIRQTRSIDSRRRIDSQISQVTQRLHINNIRNNERRDSSEILSERKNDKMMRLARSVPAAGDRRENRLNINRRLSTDTQILTEKLTRSQREETRDRNDISNSRQLADISNSRRLAGSRIDLVQRIESNKRHEPIVRNIRTSRTDERRQSIDNRDVSLSIRLEKRLELVRNDANSRREQSRRLSENQIERIDTSNDIIREVHLKGELTEKPSIVATLFSWDLLQGILMSAILIQIFKQKDDIGKSKCFNNFFGKLSSLNAKQIKAF